MKRIPTVVELGYVHARCRVMRWAGEIRWGIRRRYTQWHLSDLHVMRWAWYRNGLRSERRENHGHPTPRVHAASFGQSYAPSRYP